MILRIVTVAGLGLVSASTASSLLAGALREPLVLPALELS